MYVSLKVAAKTFQSLFAIIILFCGLGTLYFAMGLQSTMLTCTAAAFQE